jgi:hypothetical protein
MPQKLLLRYALIIDLCGNWTWYEVEYQSVGSEVSAGGLSEHLIIFLKLSVLPFVGNLGRTKI